MFQSFLEVAVGRAGGIALVWLVADTDSADFVSKSQLKIVGRLGWPASWVWLGWEWVEIFLYF